MFAAHRERVGELLEPNAPGTTGAAVEPVRRDGRKGASVSSSQSPSAHAPRGASALTRALAAAAPREEWTWPIAIAVAIAALLVGGSGCGGSSLPRPPRAPNVASAYVEVPYPPPPARVEFVPAKPSDGAVWIDGHWRWLDRWRWQLGGWVSPPPNQRYAAWAVTRATDGRLYFAPATWVDAEGRPVPSPPLLVPATGGEPEIAEAP
jgi:hypothetical protein